MSGLMTSLPSASIGPRLEKPATWGTGVSVPVTFSPIRVTTRSVPPWTYSSTAGRAVSATCTVGTEWKSLSSEAGVTLVRIMPIPPASSTACDFSTRAFDPRSQTTILPVTFAGSSEPSRQSSGVVAPARPASPANTDGPEIVSPNPTDTDAPGNCAADVSPSSPRRTVPSQVGIVDAATVAYHGDAWSAVTGSGPELPALVATKTPAAAALKNEMSSGASTVVAEPPPIE